MLKLKMMDKYDLMVATVIAVAFLFMLMIPEAALATSTAQVNARLNTAMVAVQGVLSGAVVMLGGIACLKTVSKNMAGMDDPHVKNETWKSCGAIMCAVAFGAAVPWVAPWAFGLLS